MKFVALFLIVVAFVIVENSALMCYTCLNHRQEQCAALIDPPLLANINCKKTPDDEYKLGARATCYKIEKAIWIGRDNVTYEYDRGCTIFGGKKDFCLEQHKIDPEYKCLLCNTDFCNTASVVASRNAFIVFAIAVLTFLIDRVNCRMWMT